MEKLSDEFGKKSKLEFAIYPAPQVSIVAQQNHLESVSRIIVVEIVLVLCNFMLNVTLLLLLNAWLYLGGSKTPVHNKAHLSCPF